MAPSAKAAAKGSGSFLLMRRGWLVAAVLLLVVLRPSFGAAQESVSKSSLLYRFKLAENHTITPEFSVNYDNADSDAPRHGIADVKLTYSYLGVPIVLMVNALIEYAGSDMKHQAIDKARSERYSLATSVHYTIPWEPALFQNEAVKLFATGAFHYADPNINLHKQESASGFAGLQLEW
jgi:Protein of unknown function (DUF2860)